MENSLIFHEAIRVLICQKRQNLIKLRESFRPFAPSVLEEFSNVYFDLNYPSPFMLNIVKAKEIAKKNVPSVVHFDNTCRVQTVSKIDNYHFYNLISEFNKITGVPILLNTSFNENEPIVLTPDHAFDCFRRTSMDCLVLEKDRKSTRLNSSHVSESRMPSSA